MDKVYLDDNNTHHILHLFQSESGVIKLTEYGRYNKHFKRATISMILPTRKTILKNILDSFHTVYSAIDGDLFITGSDKHYIFNRKKRYFSIPNSRVLNPCHRKNIYKSDDNSLYMSYDPILNELLLLKQPDSKLDQCCILKAIQNEGLICPSRTKKRIKHFTNEYQVMGTIEFKSDEFINLNNEKSQNIEASVEFHEVLDFEHIKNKSCIYTILQKLYNEYCKKLI